MDEKEVSEQEQTTPAEPVVEEKKEKKSNALPALVVFLLVACLIFAGVMTWSGLKKREAAAQTEPAVEAVPETAPETGEPEADVLEETGGDEAQPLPEIKVIDREALLALHDEDEVVAVVDGQEITWDLYAYWLIGNASSVENYMLTMSYYGQATDWNDPWGSESGESYLDYVLNATGEYIKQVAAIEGIAEENGVVLSQETEAEIAQAIEKDRIDSCGEDATDEEYRAYLKQNGMTPELYERLLRMSYLYQACFKQLYGENGANFSDEDTLAFLEEQGYLAANHILTTELEDAEALYGELKAIEEQEALLARFQELKQEKDEDPGKVSFPDGYVFTAGEMVPEFEEAARALELYGVSEPVQSQHGYHVILRMPLDPNAVIDYAQSGEGITARSIAASTKFNETLDARVQNAKIEYAGGFQQPDLASLLIPANGAEG